MEGTVIPDGFLQLSDAVHRLADGVWGGLRRPEPVRTLKRDKKHRNASIGFGPWKEHAGERIRTAAIEGKLQVYVFVSPQSPPSGNDPEPQVLPAKVLERLFAPRQTIPDHAWRPTLKTTGGDQKLLASLLRGILLVRAKEFDRWYRSQRAKGRWPSQRSKVKRPEGRPSVQTEPLRNAILGAMMDCPVNIAALHRHLVDIGHASVPSVDTLSRVVDQLYRETGDPKLRRIKRVRRKRV